MTHMHIPDGILPAWLWISGLLVTALGLGISIRRIGRRGAARNIPLVGALAAVMLVVMNLELVPAYHFNLSVVTGILLGPSLGFTAAFIVNVMLALMGHGGVTVLGLNTLLLGSEAVLGHAFFYFFRLLPLFWRAALATMLALLLVSLLLIAIVGVSHVDSGEFRGEHGHGADARHRSLSSFAAVVLTLGAVGWLIEGLISGAVIRFIARVKPDLLAHSLHQRTDSSSPSGNGTSR